MGDLVKAALAKVQAGGDLDVMAVARALHAALNLRHLQGAVDDPTLAGLLAERGWDGGVRPPEEGDFLLALDTNVGFNKANLFVQQALEYSLATGQDGLQATLTVHYTHTAPDDGSTRCERTFEYGPTYESLAARCYRNYLRVYAPGGSELLAHEGLNAPASEPGERGTTVFTGDFDLRPGAQHVVTLTYRLPASVPVAPYRLLVRKQAGAGNWPLIVTKGTCTQNIILNTDSWVECP
jgi:hypothetical protein